MEDTRTPEQLVGELTALLDVEQTGDDTFQGRRKRGGEGRVFGGQVIAQALASAERTVDPAREVHSLHAYFLRAGSEDHPIDYHVARDFDGGSFSNRRVVASQQGRPILNLTTSFHKREQGPSHQNAMPEVTPPEELESEWELRLRYAHLIPENRRPRQMRRSPIEMRPLEPRHWMSAKPSEPVSHTWFRACAPLADDPQLHRAALAYASDLTLLGTCTLPHGLSWILGNAVGASLDHALWFHDDVRADEWLLYVTDSPWAGRARGFNRGRIFSRDGRLVASSAQEGLVRAATPKS